MAYRCKLNQNKECDGCCSCKPEKVPETGVVIEATIKLKYTAYGLIEEEYRSGNIESAQGIAEALVDDTIDCCGLAGEDMTVEEVTIELGD